MKNSPLRYSKRAFITSFIIIILLIGMIHLGQDNVESALHRWVNPKISFHELIWYEEFDVDQLNESIWNFNVGDGCPNLCGWGNAELQYYRRENAFIESGNLIIEARKEIFVDPETGKTYNYTSARLDTIEKFKITPPARIEIKAKLPQGKGLWPAIWMLGDGWTLENYRAWPSCGEIDIMELIGSEPGVVHGTIHAPYCYGGRGVSSYYRLPKGKDFSQDYHIFAIEWTDEYIVWFVDDQVYHIVTRKEFESNGCIWVFNKPFHLVLNLAVGGYWPGKPDEFTLFPARMYIDYIKVYRIQISNTIYLDNYDSDNEIMAKTRGWPYVSYESLLNDGFDEPVDFDNAPFLNPDDWYFIGNLQLLDRSKSMVSNSVLKLCLKPISNEITDVGLGQMIWIRQNTTYIITIKAWSSTIVDLTLGLYLPSLPRKSYFSTIIKLNTTPSEFTIIYEHPIFGGNVLELILYLGGYGDKYIDVYVDAVKITPSLINWTDQYSPTQIPTGIEPTITKTPTSTTQIESTEISKEMEEGFLHVFIFVIIMSFLLTILVVRLRRSK